MADLYFVAWALMSQQVRLLIPALHLLAFSIALGVQAMVEHRPGALHAWAAGAALSASLGALLVTHEQDLRSDYEHVRHYWDRTPESLKSTVTPKFFVHFNMEFPADSKILMLNTNSSVFCERQAVVDSFFQAPGSRTGRRTVAMSPPSRSSSKAQA